ncbi:helix-turn-helix domain-containing protein [Pseudomonas sp. LRF_L74]|uniref:helix-turn-helix domain-containing protein n=1 Tax=Pseudomonas sp. LRF_L74 TaxID=3369422 RepID=UPI003F642F73
MFAEVRSFTDPQQHAGSILGWRQVYDQLGRGSLSSELRQISSDRFQMFQEVLDKRVVQHGFAPQGRLCIAMSLDVGRAPVVQKYEVGTHSVAILRDGEEFVLHAPEGIRFFAVNVDMLRFAKLAALELPQEQLQRLNTVSQIKVPDSVLQRIQQRLHPTFQYLVQGRADLSAAAEQLLEDTLLDIFLDLFNSARDEHCGRQSNLTVSSYLVKRSQELALASIDTPLTVLDLCDRLRVSRRTLQNSFQVVTGTRPVEYLRNLRLNAVRRRLMNSYVEECSIGEVAAEMGFYHLSHFSGNYRELFGEYPSETRRAQC